MNEWWFCLMVYCHMCLVSHESGPSCAGRKLKLMISNNNFNNRSILQDAWTEFPILFEGLYETIVSHDSTTSTPLINSLSFVGHIICQLSSMEMLWHLYTCICFAFIWACVLPYHKKITTHYTELEYLFLIIHVHVVMPRLTTISVHLSGAKEW